MSKAHSTPQGGTGETTKCPACGKENPKDNRYCGNCGNTLDAELHRVIQKAVHEQIRLAVEPLIKEKKVVTSEVAVAVTEQVWKYAKLFGAIMGVAVAVFVVALALVGYSDLSDLGKKVEAEKAELTNIGDATKKDVSDQTDKLKAKLQTDQKQLDVLEKDLPGLQEKDEKLKALIEAKFTELQSKVQTIQDKLDPQPYPKTEESKLQASLAPFRAYLHQIGFQRTEELPIWTLGTVSLGPTGVAISRFELGPPERLLVGPSKADVPDFLLPIYMDAALYWSEAESVRTATPADADPLHSAWYGLQEGMEYYFVCSFKDDPAAVAKAYGGGESNDYPGYLDNTRTLGSLGPRPFGFIVGGVWGGAFWEIRSKVGRAPVDSLLSATWPTIQADDVRKDLSDVEQRHRLCKRILDKWKEQRGDKDLETIRATLQKRGLDSDAPAP